MGIVELLLIFVVATGSFFWMGHKRYLRLSVVLLVCFAGLALYAILAPTPANLNESDRMGNGAARILFAICALMSAVAFFAGYGVSALKRRNADSRSKVGFE